MHELTSLGYNDSTTVTIETGQDTNTRIKEETIF